MAESGRKIALVGHCGPDAFALRSAVERAVAGAEVSMVADQGSLARALAEADLLLINRLLDGTFDMRSGIELVRMISASERPPVLMLISNYEDARAEAEAAGAAPGFGKREMNSEETGRRLREALGVAAE